LKTVYSPSKSATPVAPPATTSVPPGCSEFTSPLTDPSPSTFSSGIMAMSVDAD
jgi:hypothetical protein